MSAKPPQQATFKEKSDDLWAEATESLNPEEKARVAVHLDNRINAIKDLIDLTDVSYKKSVDKRWKYTRSNGEVVVIRDLFAKITKWVDIFQKIGDVAVSYDVSRHSTLPWAATKFILQIAVADVKKNGAIIEGLTDICYMVNFYAIVEERYLAVRPLPAAATELRNALIRLYAPVLLYLSNAKRFMEEESRLKRIVKSAFAIEEFVDGAFVDINKRRLDVDRCTFTCLAEHQTRAASAQGQEQIACLAKLEDTLSQPINRMDSTLKDIQDNLQRADRVKILTWLSSEPYIQHQKKAREGFNPNTGQWLLADENYLKWQKTSTSSILWLHGRIGSGKSKLMSLAIQCAQNEYAKGVHPQPAFFYCSRDPTKKTRSDPEAVLASIARQLSALEPAKPILKPAVIRYQESESLGFADGGLDMDQSVDIIIDLSAFYPVIIIFIDALDEIDPQKRKGLTDALKRILSESPSLVKIMVSSRDDIDIERNLEQSHNLQIDSRKNREDIEIFVKVKVDAMVNAGDILRDSLDKSKLSSLIVKKVSEGANGMFQWASLQLEYMSTLRLDEDIRSRLGKLPPELAQIYFDLYQRKLQCMSDAERAITGNLFKWLLCAKSLLRTAHIIRLIKLVVPGDHQDLSKSHLLKFCGNFVVDDDGIDTLSFAHLSVREFLEGRAEYEKSICHAFVAEACIVWTMLLFRSPASDQFLRKRYRINIVPDLPVQEPNRLSFAMPQFQESEHQFGTDDQQALALGDNYEIKLSANTYALVLWPHHAEQSGSGRQQEPLCTPFRYFLLENMCHLATGNFAPIQQWTEELCTRFLANRVFGIPNSLLDCVAWPYSPLFVSSVFGFTELVRPATRLDPIDISQCFNFNSKSHLKLTLDYSQPAVGRILLDCLLWYCPAQDVLRFCGTYCHQVPHFIFAYIEIVEDGTVIETTFRYAPELLGQAVAYSFGKSKNLEDAASEIYQNPAEFSSSGFRMTLP